MRFRFNLLSWRTAATLLVVIASCDCLSSILLGAAQCPPMPSTCIKIDVAPPDVDGFSLKCEVIASLNNPFGIGRNYNLDYTFTGWGVDPFINNVPGDPLMGLQRIVEYKLPDCPDPNIPGQPAVFPSTAVVLYPTSQQMILQFTTCCEMQGKRMKKPRISDAFRVSENT